MAQNYQIYAFIAKKGAQGGQNHKICSNYTNITLEGQKIHKK